MTAREFLEYALLALMLLNASLAVIGVVRARDALAALHACSFAAVAVTVPFVLATLASKAGSEATAKAIVLLAMVLLSSPISSHALARAIFARSEQ